MFQKDSIKYKLLLGTLSIILVLMCILLMFQLYNAFALEQEVQRSSINMLQEYSEEESRSLMSRMERDLHFYIDTMALTVSNELYDLNESSLSDKIRTFLKHSAICSIRIIDALSGSAMTQARKDGVTGCINTSVAILHDGEKIGRLDVAYSLSQFESIAEQRRDKLQDARERLHRDITTITHRSILVQVIIYAVGVLLLLNLIALQINRSIIRPIYALMRDMQLLTQSDPSAPASRDIQYGRDELGRLGRYFHDHIATLVNQLDKRANYDDLTLLFSRQRLIYDIQCSERFDLAILDIDRFKEINNLLGIGAGDALLRSTAELLQSLFSGSAYSVYRLNADEFAILEADSQDGAGFQRRVQEFVESFGRRVVTLQNNPIRVSISAGIADSADRTPMVAAMIALKYAKEKKIKIVRFNRNLPTIREYRNNLRMTNLVRDAIEDDLVVPFFQPIQDIRRGMVYKYEALMRIRDRSGTIHGPAEFLDIAKKSGAYPDLSERLILKAVECAREGDEILSINLSILDIESPGIFRLLERLRDDLGVLDRLIFEITEQEQISHSDALKEFIVAAKRGGARFAMDDFGSGYSNFESLIHLDIDFLKIDGSLIRNVTRDGSSERILETVISFARKLGIQTIAEFVTSAEIYSRISAMGVDFAQGYYIGEPVSRVGPHRQPARLAGMIAPE